MSELCLEKIRSMSFGFHIGASLIIIIAVMALISLIWTPHDVINVVDIPNRLQAPSFNYIMGTDHLGRDVFSQIMMGARISMSVAFIAVILGLGFGVPLGLLAAARGGGLDEMIMRANDLIFAFPALIIAILLTAWLGPGALNAVIAIGLFNIPVFARLTRGPALSLWSREFVMAAQVCGKNKFLISLQHILPNIIALLLVHATIQFSLGVIAEAGFSYVGLGVQPPMPSWGRMLADSQTMAGFAPWLAVFPGGMIFITVLSLNLMGESLQRVLDPKFAGSMQ